MKTQRSFTLIEILVVTAIIGLLASIVFVSLGTVRKKARVAGALQFATSLHHSIGAYAAGIWDFDEGSGLTATDLSGYENNGVLTNGPTWRCASTDSGYTPSGRGCSLEFDGSNDYVVVTGSFSAPSSLTLAFWVKFNALAGSYQFPLNSSPEATWRVGITSSGNLHFDAGSHNDVSTSINVSIDTWHHLAVSSANSGGSYNYKAYLDGEEVDSGSISNNIQAVSAVYFGSTADLLYPTNGFIDDVRIYEEAMNSAQIRQFYAEGAAEHGLLAGE